MFVGGHRRLRRFSSESVCWNWLHRSCAPETGADVETRPLVLHAEVRVRLARRCVDWCNVLILKENYILLERALNGCGGGLASVIWPRLSPLGNSR
jgi:hypothetical protein